MKIAVGPSLHYPSWQWRMNDLIPDLETHHNITVFKKYNELRNLNFNLLIAVKFPPPNEFQVGAKKIIYLPVDYFKRESQIAEHSTFLRSCSIIAIHCTRLISLLKPHCNRIEFIDHYDKYVLTKPARFRKRGLVIWTGINHYINLVREWYDEKPRNFQLTVLTNRTKKLSTDLRNHPGISLRDWSEQTQRECFGRAKAGLDVKGSSFHQQTKPPTKIQQFVASGIPTAVNHSSYAWEYFHERGFDLVDPDDTERWFSETYWKETSDFAPKLRQAISKANVVQSYLNLISIA